MDKTFMKNGIELINLDAQMASVRLRFPFGKITASESLEKRITQASQFYHEGNVNVGRDGSQFNFENIGDVLPTEADYILVPFRAISKTVVPGHWLDWTKDNVLRDSMQKLLGQTVYPNHDYTDINNWLGSVASVEWDEAGEQSNGVPGINAVYKIDAVMNPRIARGLIINPPAIHSTSMTVLFKYEYSHPAIAAENRYRFFDLLGEEVEGEIVRLIVTEVIEYWEASLVFMGADRLAKQQEKDSFSVKKEETRQGTKDPEQLKEGVKTMNLTQEQKAKLGIEFDGDDVPESLILKSAESAIDSLNESIEAFGPTKPDEIATLRQQAAAGVKFIEKLRAEVIRLAKLAEFGGEEGELAGVITKQIAASDFDTLVELEDFYGKKAAEKFPKIARSSIEDNDAIDMAGGVNQQRATAPAIGLH